LKSGPPDRQSIVGFAEEFSGTIERDLHRSGLVRVHLNPEADLSAHGEHLVIVGKEALDPPRLLGACIIDEMVSCGGGIADRVSWRMNQSPGSVGSQSVKPRGMSVAAIAGSRSLPMECSRPTQAPSKKPSPRGTGENVAATLARPKLRMPLRGRMRGQRLFPRRKASGRGSQISQSETEKSPSEAGRLEAGDDPLG
jgi:hypothetical protein